MHIHVSHQSNQLIEKLKGLLYASNDKFTSKLLVVPCDHVKKKIEMAFCDDPNLGVFMGVRSLNLNLMMAHLLKIFPIKHRFASQSDLAFMIEKEIKDKKEPHFYDALGGVFLKYGLYFGDGWQEWKKEKGWQQQLFSVLSETFTFPLDLFETLAPIDSSAKKVEIHIFGMSEIPPLYFDYLLQASKHLTIHLYQLTYSNRYWGDLLSARQKLSLTKKLTSEGVNTDALEEYLDHHNPLFSNLCRYGQSLLVKLLDSNLPIDENEGEPQFRPTLLGALQSDLFCLDEPQVGAIEKDETLLVYEAPHIVAEVQNLYNALCLTMKNEKITPDQISVLAPDINLYAPYIELIFGKEESHLGYQIEGVSMMIKNETFKLIHHVLDLFNGRWEKAKILEILESGAFQKKLGIELSEISILKTWLDKCNMLWGFNEAHRQSFVNDQVGGKGTLEQAFTEVLGSLAHEVSSGFTSELTLAPLIEKWISYFRKISDGMGEIKSCERTLKEWYWILWQFFAQLVEDCDEFVLGLRSLFKIEEVTDDTLYSFDSIEPHLRHILSAKKGFVRNREKPPIRFASIQPGEAYFSDCVALIGLNQGEFPRYTPPYSFDCLPQNSDYYPKQNQIDRFFFLEALSCTKKTLILSYQEDPSPCIADLLSHLQQRFGIDSMVEPVLDLPFVEGQLKGSYLPSAYTYASHFEVPKKSMGTLFSSAEVQEEKMSFTVADLKTIARNPYQYIANRYFNFYHRNSLHNEEWLKEFILTHFDKALLRAASLHTPYSELIKQLEKQVSIGSKLFEQVAQLDLKDEYDTMQQTLDRYHLSLFSIIFTPFAKSLSQIDETLYEHPPLVIDGIEITGRLDNLAKEGVITVGRSRFEDYFKAWPLLLIAKEVEGLFDEDFYLFTLRDAKRKKVEVENGLASFMSYAAAVKQLQAPLHPSLAESLLVKKENDYKKEVKALFSDRSLLSDDPYLQWVFHSHHEVLEHVDFNEYQQKMGQAFSNLVNWVKR